MAQTEITPRLLLAFVVLADELHFGRAADRLHVTQPALTRSLQRLERSTRRRLFSRTTRTVALTRAGEELLPAARDVLGELDALAAELALRRGRLRVAHLPGSETLGRILERRPALDVDEESLPARAQLASVVAGRLDVAVCVAPDPLPAGLRSMPLRLDPLQVVVPGRPAGNARPVDVRRRAIAVVAGGEELATLVAAYERRVGVTLRRVAAPGGPADEASTMRRSGARAFAVLASHPLAHEPALVRVAALPVQAYLPWSLVWRARARGPALDAFLAAAAEAKGAHGWCVVDAGASEPWVPGGDEQAWRHAA